MGWLRNLFSAIARGFAWIGDAWVFVFNFAVRLLNTLWGRFVLLFIPLIIIFWVTHKLAAYVAAPIRRFFLNGAHAGLTGNSFDFSSLICNWVGALNYFFPLDETLNIVVHMVLILFGLWTVLSILRLVKTAIGGWI